MKSSISKSIIKPKTICPVKDACLKANPDFHCSHNGIEESSIYYCSRITTIKNKSKLIQSKK